MKSKQKKVKISRRLKQQAVQLLNDPKFLFRACQKVGELGVVGEKRNRLILLLAAIARVFPEPPSVLLKGETSSGKSTLVKKALQLFPPTCVVERAGLSKKALLHGKGSLAHKILFIHEHRCGKDAQQLLRLLQSEGKITHEFTTIGARKRGTSIVQRVGIPVVLSTTTEKKVFADDETRFLSSYVDDSPEQNLAIVTARAKGPQITNSSDVHIWRAAMSLLSCRAGDFEQHPEWLQYVAKQLPLDDARVRRDWNRFVVFCQAVALCRVFRRGQPVNIRFSDYCVAYKIFEPAFSSTLRGLPTQELNLVKAIATLNKTFKRSVTGREIARELDWNEKVVYKRAKEAEQSRLIEYEKGTRERNVKLISIASKVPSEFLPSPKIVFRHNPAIGKKVKYVDPFSGEWKTIKR